MNCWKSINIVAQYGLHRITLISIIIGLLSFILLFLSFSLVFHGITVSAKYFGWFCLSSASMFTMHKLCHAMPLLATRKQVQFRWRMKSYMPYMIIKTNKPYTKFLSYIIFLSPFFIITGALLLLASIFPSYYHYFALLASFNIGLCFPDFLYVKHIHGAPSTCQIEELESGYDILIRNETQIAS